ncbi:hypothetical protein BH09ACT6_BH09ACT6_15080 [soil metagenome]
MKHSAFKYAAVAVSIATSLVVFSGCAASGGGGASSSADPGIDVTNKTITLGGWQSASGGVAVYKSVTAGAKAYFDSVNASGGFNGWKVNYSPPDDGSDPARALQAVKSQVESNEVFALVAGPASPQNAQVTPYVEQMKVPYVGPNDNGDNYLGKDLKWIFPVNPPYSAMDATSVSYAATALGAKKFALVYQDDAVGQPVNAKFAAMVTAVGGTVVDRLPIKITDVDFSAVGRALEESAPDVIIYEGGPANLVKVKTAVLSAGLNNAKWFAPYYDADPATVDLGPQVMEGTYFPYPTDAFFEDTPAIAKYQADVTTYAPDAKIGALTLAGYTNASAMGAVLDDITKNGATPTRSALVAAAQTFDKRSVGLISSLTWTPEHLGITSAKIFQLRGGKFTIVQEPQPLVYYK